MLKNIRYLGIFVLIISCGNPSVSNDISEQYITANNTYWKEKDDSRVFYLEVIALHKLDSLDNSFGRGSHNDLVLNFDALPETIGTINIGKEAIVFSNTEGVEVTTEEGTLITTMSLKLDEYGSSQMLYHDRLKWRVITRSGQHYIRVWDKMNPEVRAFKGFKKFDLNSNFSFDASFSYFERERSEFVKSEVDGQRNISFIGQVSFEYNDETYTLDVGESGFTMVADDTSGETTYGGGRYIYLDLPESNGQVSLDFNRLYNPPCAFNKYTTCLYPPRQNYLPFALLAGETNNRIK